MIVEAADVLRRLQTTVLNYGEAIVTSTVPSRPINSLMILERTPALHQLGPPC